MLSNFLSIGRIVFYVLLISIAYNCCIAYRIFLLCGISVTGHFHYVVFSPQGISIMWLFRYRAFPLRSFFATGHFHNVAFPLRGISTAWFFRYMTFLLCGVYATWHFPCMVYPWCFCVFRPFTFESDFSIFSIHCVGVTCMFYCTPFSGCFRGGHVCFSFSSFSHFLRFSHIISSSPMFLKSEATEALIRGKDHPIRPEPKATRLRGAS